jgi:hypothetical protein
MAPKAGAEVRRDLSDGYSSVRDAAQRRYRDIADRAAAKYEEASAKIEEKVDQYKGRTPRQPWATSRRRAAFRTRRRRPQC